MDPDLEIARAVQENRRLIEENNQILKKIQRHMAIGTAIKIIYWVVILGVAFGAYYLIQPYLDSIGEIYGNVKVGADQVQQVGGEVKNAGSIENILSTFGDLVN